MNDVLKIDRVDSYYGKMQVLRSVSLGVPEGQIVALLGGNGAGKTTVMRTISGVVRAKEGDILFYNDSIVRFRSSEIVRKGISLVPQGRELFDEMTVRENLEMGAVIRNDKKGILQDMDVIYKYFPILRDRMQQKALTLSGGEQQMLAIGRGLMSNPRLLMMDEPTAGLAPLLVKEIGRIISMLNGDRKNIFLVEQNVPMAMEVCDHFYIIKNGQIVFSASKDEIGDLDEIVKNYLE